MQLYLPLGRGPGLFQGVKTRLLLPKAGLIFGGLVVFVPGIQGSSGFQQDFQSGQFTVADPKKVMLVCALLQILAKEQGGVTKKVQPDAVLVV